MAHEDKRYDGLRFELADVLEEFERRGGDNSTIFLVCSQLACAAAYEGGISRDEVVREIVDIYDEVAELSRIAQPTKEGA